MKSKTSKIDAARRRWPDVYRALDEVTEIGRQFECENAELRARLEQAETRCRILQVVTDAAQKFVATPQVDPDEYDGKAYEICCSALNELETALAALSPEAAIGCSARYLREQLEQAGALKGYVLHGSICAIFDDKPCDCGLDELLKALSPTDSNGGPQWLTR